MSGPAPVVRNGQDRGRVAAQQVVDDRTVAARRGRRGWPRRGGPRAWPRPAAATPTAAIVRRSSRASTPWTRSSRGREPPVHGGATDAGPLGHVVDAPAAEPVGAQQRLGGVEQGATLVVVARACHRPPRRSGRARGVSLRRAIGSPLASARTRFQPVLRPAAASARRTARSATPCGRPARWRRARAGRPGSTGCRTARAPRGAGRRWR